MELEAGQLTELEMHCVTAAEEYEKNKDLDKKDITLLKEWLTTQPHLPAITEEMLILFHHSCYFVLEKTKACIDCYYTLRTNTPEIFANRDVTSPELAKSLSAFYFTILPKVTPTGYRIVYHGLRQLEPSRYMFADNLKLQVMCMDACLRMTGSSEGFVIVFNMQGTRLAHLTRVSLGAMRRFLQYLQEANPVRLKAIYLINVVPFIDRCVSLVKPFMYKELMGLLHFHHGDMESFHQHIPAACLPRDLGGELASVEELCDEHNRQLANLSGYFLEESRMRVDETKRQKGKRKKNPEPNVAFQKLDID